jgi:hypothetical protein
MLIFIAAIITLNIVVVSSLFMITYGVPIDSNFKELKSNINYNSSNLDIQNKLYNDLTGNTTILTTNNNKTKGLLIVKVTVINNKIGNKTPSDFIIKLHANDPSPISFAGNSSGTEVKIGMGMYGVSEYPLADYNSHYSTDCFGGIMSIDTKECIVTNTYNRSLAH